MIKEYFNKHIVSLKKVIIMPVIISFILSAISYNIGGAHKINALVDKKVQAKVEEINAVTSELQQENKGLSDYKTELNNVLSSKGNSQTALSEYNTNKESYSKQISALQYRVETMSKDIQKKQGELNERKEQQNKLSKEKEKERKIVEAKDQSEEMVWIGETGTKYHYEHCPTLKGNKYQITLKEAQAQGRTACKVCH